MDIIEAMLQFLLICMCLFPLLSLFLFLNNFWWKPIYIQRLMKSQGIKGPSYNFFHGNTKQILKMIKESTSSPMEYVSHDIFPRLQPHIYSWLQQYGNVVLSWHGPCAQLIVTQPEMIKEILSNKDGGFPKRNPDSFVKKLIGDGIVLTTDTEKWSKVRKIANHAFHADSLKGMIPSMIASVEGMLERWKYKYHNGMEIEVYEEFRVMTSEIISRSAFGSSYLEGENIFKMLVKLVDIVSRNQLKIRIPGIRKFVKSSDDIESDKIEQTIHDSILNIIKERDKKMMTGDGLESDFLGELIKANHGSRDNIRISVEDVIAECKTFYFAGQETTTNLLTWTILLLAIHTDWQEKARKEVLELFGNDNPNWDGITKLKIMNMIINESLRIYSPVIALIRKVKREVTLGKLVVPANVQFVIPILMLHHNPEIWGQDAHLFKPERFAEGVLKATNNHPTAFIPFGFGPRSCVGLNFAINEAKIALSMILQRYKFDLSPKYVHAPIQAITTCPRHGIQILLRKIVDYDKSFE